MPPSAAKVDAVTTDHCQSRPAGVTAIVPDPLNILFAIVPLIIFSYALDENPAAAKFSLAVPAPVASLATTPLLFTKFLVLT